MEMHVEVKVDGVIYSVDNYDGEVTIWNWNAESHRVGRYFVSTDMTRPELKRDAISKIRKWLKKGGD